MENVTNKALVFKADDVKITLGETEYRLVYDLNAFCELEKIYGSIDDVLKLILGAPEIAAEAEIKNDDETTSTIAVDKITVGGTPLTSILQKASSSPKATMADTLNLLYAGLMHDAAIYNTHDEITGYKISKSRIGSHINIANVREVNARIVAAIIRDLVPAKSDDTGKNVEAPEAE